VSEPRSLGVKHCKTDHDNNKMSIALGWFALQPPTPPSTKIVVALESLLCTLASAIVTVRNFAAYWSEQGNRNVDPCPPRFSNRRVSSYRHHFFCISPDALLLSHDDILKHSSPEGLRISERKYLFLPSFNIISDATTEQESTMCLLSLDLSSFWAEMLTSVGLLSLIW